MQNVNSQCAAAFAALLLSAGPVMADTPAADAVDQVVEAIEQDVETIDTTAIAGAEGAEVPAVDDGFASDQERISYAIGIDIGRSFKAQGIDIDVNLLREALAAAYGGEALRQSEEQSLAALRLFQETMVARQASEASDAGSANAEKSLAFLTENGTREGVVTTESGLQYEILEAGEGDIAGPADTVELNYTGTLIDGTTFDSSVGRGPASFPVAGVIPGFSEGLQLLPVGTKAKLYMDPQLAYGDSPQGPGGPGSALIFEVEILSIVAAPEAPSLEEQIKQAEMRLADDLAAVREQGAQQIAELKSQMEAGDGSSATVGGEEPETVERKKEPMYD